LFEVIEAYVCLLELTELQKDVLAKRKKHPLDNELDNNFEETSNKIWEH